MLINMDHRVYVVTLLSYLHRRHCNVDWHRVYIVSFLSFYIVDIVDIIDIQMLIDIESTWCLFCIPFFCCLHCRHRNVDWHCVYIVVASFISFTSSTFQCWSTLNRHCDSYSANNVNKWYKRNVNPYTDDLFNQINTEACKQAFHLSRSLSSPGTCPVGS